MKRALACALLGALAAGLLVACSSGADVADKAQEKAPRRGRSSAGSAQRETDSNARQRSRQSPFSLAPGQIQVTGRAVKTCEGAGNRCRPGPVPNVKIVVLNLKDFKLDEVTRTQADEKGEFVFAVLPGRYTLVPQSIIRNVGIAAPVNFEAVDRPLKLEVTYYADLEP